MKNRHVTQINVYHTPDKTSKPDLQHQSHLKTTVPSIYQNTQSKGMKSAYYNPQTQKKNYQNVGIGQIYSQKRASKNQWQLKEKVDQYETQIGLLEQYLRSCNCNCIQKNSISRIFGFPSDKDRLQYEQQKALKQLGTKVKTLIVQNSQLKSQLSQPYYSQLNSQELVQQNHKLQMLLEQYRVSDSLNHERLIQQAEILKDQNYRLRIDYQQKIKLLEIEYQTKINMFRTNEHQYLRKIDLLQRQKDQSLRNSQLQYEKSNLSMIRQIEEKYYKQLKDIQNQWKQKLQDQQNYYMRIKEEWETVNQQHRERMHQDQMKKLQKYYTDLINDIQVEQKQKFEGLVNKIIEMEERIGKTNSSIDHLKFQRENRIQSTIKKSRNVAALSTKPRGEEIEEILIAQGQDQTQPPKPLNYSFNASNQSSLPQIQILNQKIKYLERQNNELKMKLNISQKIMSQKTQKIIIYENQIKNLNQNIQNLNRSLTEIQSSKISKPSQTVPIAIDYSQEVKNIKQTIKSCNLSNFDIFQTQFNEIIEQRNQMNEKLASLKNQAKQSSKILVLEKHLKVQRQKNKKLEQSLRRYESQIENLKIQIIELQGQIQKIHANQIINDVQQSHVKSTSNVNLPDGKAGLEWQKVVQHCLLTSIKRLQLLQNRMKEDLSRNQ